MRKSFFLFCVFFCVAGRAIAADAGVRIAVLIEERGTPERTLVMTKQKGSVEGLALPTGMIKPGETLEEAAHRIVFDQTGMSITKFRLFHIYDTPDCYPEGTLAETVYLCSHAGEDLSKNGLESSPFWAPLSMIREEIWNFLALDHQRVLNDYFHCRECDD